MKIYFYDNKAININEYILRINRVNDERFHLETVCFDLFAWFLSLPTLLKSTLVKYFSQLFENKVEFFLIKNTTRVNIKEHEKSLKIFYIKF